MAEEGKGPVSQVKEKYFRRSLWIAITFISFGAAIFLIGVGLHLKGLSDETSQVISKASKFGQAQDFPQCELIYDQVLVSPHPDNCNQFYKCENGTLTLETCENGLLFDGKGSGVHNFCNYHWSVDCGARHFDLQESRTPGCQYAWGIFPHPELACGTTYIKCVAGEPYEEPCTIGLAYDDQIHACNWPDLLPACNPEEIVGFKCPAELSPSDPAYKFWPYPRFSTGSCESLITCVNNFPRLIRCEDGKVFNELSLTCDYPENVPACANYYKDK